MVQLLFENSKIIYLHFELNFILLSAVLYHKNAPKFVILTMPLFSQTANTGELERPTAVTGGNKGVQTELQIAIRA